MSSVVIAGDTSGSVTLSAPAVSGTTTLTLPSTSGTVLTTGSTFAGTGPAFRANTITAQTITTSTFTKIAFNVEEFDTNSNYDPTTNYRFTPSVAGYYQINANASLGGGSVGYVQCAIFKNGSHYTSGSGIPNNGIIGGMVTVASVVFLNGSTDYVEFYLWQNQGTSINLQTATGNNTFSGAMVRSA